MDNHLHSMISSVVDIVKDALGQFAGKENKHILNELSNTWYALSQFDHKDSQAWDTYISTFQKGHIQFLRGKTRKKTDRGQELPASLADDPKFSAQEWHDVPFFNFLRKAYLLLSELLVAITEAAELDPKDKKKLLFSVKFFLSAICPANFFMTNPEAIKLAIETKGKSLQDGLENYSEDIKKGRISITDEAAFQVGHNIAATPGSVIYENSIMQLIHYNPTTLLVSHRPMLIVPPCINKFYILDLQKQNSFIRYCLDQGHQVFCISWVNPDIQHDGLSWDDYLSNGVLTAMDIAKNVAGSDKIHVLGWCIGGTLLATALAVLTGRGKESDISSATFITTMLDFSEPGDMGLFLDGVQFDTLAAQVKRTGVISGEYFFHFFALVKAETLIWPYVVNNYLKGRKPTAFDFLYWNSDSTNLPADLYLDFISKFLLRNALVEPGGVILCDVPIDLAKIKTPRYFISTVDDHIVPWQATFRNVDIFTGPNEFVLGASGHVAGVINPPVPPKRNYWINGETGLGPAHWLNSATSIPGSWWTHWNQWLKQRSGKMVAAPQKPGNDTYKKIEKAPGRYVKRRIIPWNPDAVRRG